MKRGEIKKSNRVEIDRNGESEEDGLRKAPFIFLARRMRAMRVDGYAVEGVTSPRGVTKCSVYEKGTHRAGQKRRRKEALVLGEGAVCVRVCVRVRLFFCFFRFTRPARGLSYLQAFLNLDGVKRPVRALVIVGDDIARAHRAAARKGDGSARTSGDTGNAHFDGRRSGPHHTHARGGAPRHGDGAGNRGGGEAARNGADHLQDDEADDDRTRVLWL